MISVIVPVYNVCEYLERCIRSVLEQTYQDFELILVDDGSNDGSEMICDQYASENSRVFAIHQKNAGPSAARNVGIEAAKGEYIAFIDSDDFIHEKMLEILYVNSKKYDADISVCDIWWQEENDDISYETGENKTEVFEGNAVMQQLFDKELVTIVPWSKLYKRVIFEHLRFPEGKLYEDEIIIHSLLYECRRSVYTSCKLYYYMKHKNSRSASLLNQRKLQGIIQAFSERLLFFEEKGLRDGYDRTFKRLVSMHVDYYEKLEEQNTAEKEQLQEWLLQDMYQRLVEYRKKNPYQAEEYLCYLLWSKNPKWGRGAFYLREKYNLCVHKLKAILDSDRRK